ncbi:RNA polymerase sigma factor [Aliikangiella maris]|uniref:Sigma-70 family RNA polymerase sigma factor n=2 Tax=Aliikangiella maris TaxID=3162458 RepID=A0ABV3MNN5_9GAMM
MQANRQKTGNLVYWPVASSQQLKANMTSLSNSQSGDCKAWSEHLHAIATRADRNAYKALYLHFFPKIKSFYYQQGLAAHADELAHEVFIKVWQKAFTYQSDKASVSTWLFTIVRNLRIDFLRRKKIDECSDENAPEPVQEDRSLAHVQALRNKQQLNELFKQLTEEQRNALQKVYFEDKSHQLAAEELNMTLGTLKSRVRSALRVLRSHLGGESV